MFKGAGIIFALSFFLFNCAAHTPIQPAPPPPLLPDLSITYMFINPQNKLAVTVTNAGNYFLFLGTGNMKIYVDGTLKESYALDRLAGQSVLSAKKSLTINTPFAFSGKHEIGVQIVFSEAVKELSVENNILRKILEGGAPEPDVLIKDLGLTEDMDLMIILSNAGAVDLRKDITYHFQIIINDKKVSEFEHFIPEELKANFGNSYVISPPSRVEISGEARVKVSIFPVSSVQETRPETHVLEKTFIVDPFKIEPRGRKEFPFVFSVPSKDRDPFKDQLEIEARWEGGHPSLELSFKIPGAEQRIPAFTGKSPLNVEFPIPFLETEKENHWTVWVTNLEDKNLLNGVLIIKHP